MRLMMSPRSPSSRSVASASVGDDPLARTDLIGEAKDFELAQPADLERVEFVRLAVGTRREIDDAGAAAVARKLTIELGPALGLDLALESAADLEIGARAELLRDEIARAVAHAFLDVVARDDEVLAVVAHAAHDEMDMGIVGVPVIDGDPVEPACRDPFPSARSGRG